MKTKPCHCCDGSGKETDQAALADSLRSERKATGRKLRDVSDRMGISVSYLSDLERSKRNWNDALVVRFKRACNE